MKWRKKKLTDAQIKENQWRLQMFKRRGCEVNKYSMKVGK